MKELLKIAVRAIRSGAEILNEHFGRINLSQADSKGTADYVSEVDRRSEDAMREFRNRCINYYMDKYNYIDNIDNQMFLMRNYIIQDLIDNYTLNDVKLMAFHFANIDNIDNKYQLASIVANIYFNNI